VLAFDGAITAPFTPASLVLGGLASLALVAARRRVAGK